MRLLRKKGIMFLSYAVRASHPKNFCLKNI
jgi:hypothetical protein